MRTREDWNNRGWTDPEALLLGWCHARHWEALVYPEEDLLVIRPKAKKERPLQVEGPVPPGLFD